VALAALRERAAQVVESSEEGVEHGRLRLVAAEHDPDLAE